jgi:Dpy-30 motif
MTGSSRVNVNALPSKAYLEATIVPTVMRALHEVAHARPDNPLEFVAYYILKHNPNRKEATAAPQTDATLVMDSSKATV